MTKKIKEIPAEIRRMSFEQALSELEVIVEQLESGEVDLEESISTYTRGNMLKRHCEAKLADAKEKIEQIDLATDGSIKITPINRS